jgi:hypothetical protein
MMVMEYDYRVDLQRFLTERRNVLSDDVFLAHRGVVEGDIAEFGIHVGSTFDVLAKTIAAVDIATRKLRMKPKILHGFDSFEGMPPARLQEDIDSPDGSTWCLGPGHMRFAGGIENPRAGYPTSPAGPRTPISGMVQ